MTSMFDLTYYAMLERSHRNAPHDPVLAATTAAPDGTSTSRFDAQH